DAVAARPAAPVTDGRTARRAGTTADAPGNDRMELRASRRGRATALRVPGRLRRRVHARGRRAGLRGGPGHAPVTRRQESRPTERDEIRRALLDAADDPRVRARAARAASRRRGGRPT